MSTATAPALSTGTDAPEGRNTLRMVGLVVLTLALVAGAAWFFVLRPAGESEPKPGEVVQLEPIQVNLSGSHYLRLGLALQLTEKAQEVDGSKALDAAISVFSGRMVADVNQPDMRERLRKRLTKALTERYHGDVMEVYFTEYVTQ